jgi:hypothetical protein
LVSDYYYLLRAEFLFRLPSFELGNQKDMFILVEVSGSVATGTIVPFVIVRHAKLNSSFCALFVPTLADKHSKGKT